MMMVMVTSRMIDLERYLTTLPDL